ncbi:MAG: hypothetical protein HKN60_04010, partial [Rhizobiales bacterium]|nr:hypothetical protein [Hyphomicrobiales bacterium]
HQPMGSGYSRREILQIRHHSLYTPRDFDLSPYFTVVKPTVYGGFKYKELSWAHQHHDQASESVKPQLDSERSI